MKAPTTAPSWSRPGTEQATPTTSPSGLARAPSTALTFHWGGQGGDSGLRVAEVHLLVQAAQGMEGRVRVLLHKQVPGVDLADHNHLHSDAIREHELQGRDGSEPCSNPSHVWVKPPRPGASL